MRFKAELTEPGIWRWCGLVCVLLAIATATEANDASHYRIEAATDCPQDMVDAHVRQQFALYGPRSKVGEYFGFVFFFEGSIDSAVVKGRDCPTSNLCSIDTAKAASLIPKGAKVLGEWHTHPQNGGAGILSAEDVRGARVIATSAAMRPTTVSRMATSMPGIPTRHRFLPPWPPES